MLAAVMPPSARTGVSPASSHAALKAARPVFGNNKLSGNRFAEDGAEEDKVGPAFFCPANFVKIVAGHADRGLPRSKQLSNLSWRKLVFAGGKMNAVRSGRHRNVRPGVDQKLRSGTPFMDRAEDLPRRADEVLGEQILLP